jgi:hypothetical protein
MNVAVDPQQVIELVQRAQLSLCFNQEMLAEMLGSSLRTVQRWAANKSCPSDEQLRKLAVAVHPCDADLGRRIAAVVRETPESLGLVAPAAVSTAPARPAAVTEMLVDSIVSAAADALDVSPRVARPALLAAMERATLAGLGVDEVLAVLRPSPAPAPAPREMPPTPAPGSRRVAKLSRVLKKRN